MFSSNLILLNFPIILKNHQNEPKIKTTQQIQIRYLLHPRQTGLYHPCPLHSIPPRPYILHNLHSFNISLIPTICFNSKFTVLLCAQNFRYRFQSFCCIVFCFLDAEKPHFLVQPGTGRDLQRTIFSGYYYYFVRIKSDWIIESWCHHFLKR